MANRIQLRRGSATQWSNANPTLTQGELGIELDTGRIKIGDGVTAWNSLRYERPIESVSATANTLVQRDADGNFSAGTITASIIGNASTASRLSSTRQIQLAQDVTGSGVFDGSANLTINTVLGLVSSLPHYDGTDTSSGTYTKVVVDAKGRITNASNPTTIQDYGLNGTVVGQSAQPYDNDLTSITNLADGAAGFGLMARTSTGNITVRDIVSASNLRILVDNGDGIGGNPAIDLANTTVVPDPTTYSQGLYNTESLTSVTSTGANGEPVGNQTVNTVKFTVDKYGRLQSATNVPIATAREGSKYDAYGAGVTYNRYDIIEEGGNVYQSITGISAGAGAPTHTDSSDTGGWRFLAAAATEQKGLASFAQEDFDVDSNGHVTIAAAGVDNTQLQNNRIIFTDQNTVQEFELDNELTTATAHTGFDYLNYIKVNDTSGNLLFSANNTGDSGTGEVDINVRTYFSDADVTFDGALDQTIDKTADGNFTIQTTQNSASARAFNLAITNAGAGSSTLNVTAEDVVNIQASDANGKVHVEDARFQSNYIATTNATLNLDPGDDRAVTGVVRVWGDLQVDGTTTTVNSTTLQVDDPIITLGGDTAPVADDNLDRGIEFRYYDTAAKLGFYGYDDSYTDLAGHVGGFRFLYDATNTSEVFSGTDAGLIGGNLRLTTGTNSTSNTTGDLAVAGGVGITQDVNIGGLVDIDSTLRVHSTSRFDDNMVIQGASKTLQLNNGSGTTRIELQSTTGNADFYGIVNITNDLNINTNKFNVASATGNTDIAGTLDVVGNTTLTGALDLNNTMNVSGFTYLENTDEPQIALNSGTGLYEIQNSDYGAFRFDGGGYIEGDFMFNSDVYVNGTVVQKQDETATFNQQNYLNVRYIQYIGSSSARTPSYASDTTTNLRVFGGVGIGTDLHIGDDLYIGKLNSTDTTEFEVLGESGNTTIGRSGAGTASVGTLTVHGDVTFNRDLFANGNITLGNATSDTLTVQANSEFNGTVDVDADFAVRSGTTDKFFVDNVTGNTDIQGTLTVASTSEFNNTVDVDANFAVRTSAGTDKFTVASASGNVATDGTLVVQGQTTINDSLIVDAANEVFSIRNGSAVEKFGVDADNGNTSIIGTLTVGDATQINDTFGASGIVTLTNNTEQTLTGLYGADGGLRVTGGAAIQRNLAVGGSMRVYGDFEISGATTQSGNTGFSGRVSITNTSDATSFTDNSVALTTDGGFRASGNAWVGGDFYVWDNANSRNAFFVDVSTGDATLHNTLTVGGNLVVNGTTTTVNSTVTTLDDPIITLGGDTAPVSNDGKDRGVEFRYYDGSAKVGFFGFDRSSSQFTFLTDATNTSEVLAGTDAALRAGSLNLTGAGTSLDVDANANIDGTLTVDGQIISQVTSGPALVIPNTTKINNLNADLLDGLNTSSTDQSSASVVVRDSSGNFRAGTITAALTGNASTATTLETTRSITVTGAITGSFNFNGGGNVTYSTSFGDPDVTALAAMAGTGLVVRTAAATYAQRSVTATALSGITITNADGVAGDIAINVASASTNASNNLVLRDGSGNFAANVITADLTGDVTGNLVATTSTVKNLNPATDSTYDLGTSLIRWNKIWTDQLSVASGAAFSAAVSFENNITVTGTITATGGVIGNASTASAVSVSQSGSQTDHFVAMAANTAGTGTTSIRADAGLKFNTGTNILTAGGFSGPLSGDVTGDVTGDLTGNADTATQVATQTVQVNFNQEHFLPFVVSNSASLLNQSILTDGGATYNPFQNRITAQTFAGDLTGNVDGNVAGEVTLEGAVPATATSTGTAGDVRYDADYVYVCVATNTWKRSALATW